MVPYPLFEFASSSPMFITKDEKKHYVLLKDLIRPNTRNESIFACIAPNVLVAQTFSPDIRVIVW